MVGSKLGPYEIRGRIGAGGMGEVYRAHDPRLGRDVALKLLPPDMARHPDRLTRFEREAKALAALNHPNIVTIHSIEEADGRRFLTMELIDGDTLNTAVSNRRPDLRGTLRLAVALADALSAAHEKGIVHRDLKPSNVMVTRDGRLKVLDFGLAKPTVSEGDGERTLALTEPVSAVGAVVGTAPYMAPEQIRGENLDARADLFAFGILLYEMLTGRRPFRGRTTADVTSAILRDTPDPPHTLRPDVPRDLERIVQRCLAKDRDRRFQTAKDVRNELDIVLEEISSGGAVSSGSAAPAASSTEHPAASAPPSSIPTPPTPLPQSAAPSSASTPSSGGPEPSSVAVLFFENLGGDPQDDFFCEGMTEDLITEVSRIGNLTVFPRSTVAPYRGSNWQSLDVARQLGASHFVEGSMRRAGDRLRVTARLVEAAGGHAVWSERFDRQMEDVFDIQDDIARSVARALRVRLTDSEERKLQKGGTRNLSAYEYYLRGRSEFRQTGIVASAEVVDFSVAMYRKAIEIDPEYARAFAGIAEHRAVHVLWHGGGAKEFEEAREAAARALRIDPDLPEGLVAQALVRQLEHRIDEARASFARAVEVQPRLWEAHYLRGRMEFSVGEMEAAAESFRRGAEVDPEDVQCLKLLVMVLEATGRRADAKVEAEKALERVRHRLELEPDLPFLLDARAQMLSTIGRHEEAMRFAEEALTRPNLPRAYRYNAACLFGKGGRPDRAKEILLDLLRTGFGDASFIRNDPDVAAVIDDPEVRALLDARDGKSGAR